MRREDNRKIVFDPHEVPNKYVTRNQTLNCITCSLNAVCEMMTRLIKIEYGTKNDQID